MSDICSVCGLPKDLCVCDQINDENKKLYVTERRVRGRKFITSITGFDNPKDAQELYKDLKVELACGGTSKNGTVELQGKHQRKVKEILLKKGYSEDQIN